MKIVITNAANTAMYPDDVTGLQDNVTEDVKRAGSLKLVSKVCLHYFVISIRICERSLSINYINDDIC